MRAVLYARVSTRNQEDNASLDSQLAACRKYAEAHNLETIREVREVFSGFYLFDRPLLNEIRREIKQGKYDVLLVYDVDRLTRNMSHLGVLLTECERYNTNLIFASGDFENTADGKLLLSIKSYLAEAERVKIAERTTRGRRAKAESGTLSYKRKLFGYQLDEDGKRIVNENESAVVKRIFADYLNEKSLRQIAENLNTENIPTPTGKTWYPRSVQVILNNPAFAGRTTVFREKQVFKFVEGERRSQRKYQDTGTVELPNITPPIVSESDFEAVQKQLQINRKQKRGLAKHDFLLRGLVRCAKCGRMFSPHKHTGSRRYVCTSSQLKTINCHTPSLNANYAEKLVSDEIGKILDSEKKLAKYIEKRENINTPKPSDNSSKIRQLEKEIENLVSRMATVNETVWKIAEKEIEKREKQIAEMKAVKAETAQTFNASAFLSAVRGIEFEKRPFADKIKILKLFDFSATFDGKNLKINLGG